jgi:hypothetical protein
MSNTGQPLVQTLMDGNSDTGTKADCRQPPILQLLNSDLILLCYLCLLLFNPISCVSFCPRSPFAGERQTANGEPRTPPVVVSRQWT